MESLLSDVFPVVEPCLSVLPRVQSLDVIFEVGSCNINLI